MFALKITTGLKCELILWHLEKGLEWPFCAVKPLPSAYVSSLGAHLWVNKLFPVCRSPTRASGMCHRDVSCGQLRVRTCVLAGVAMAGSDALSVMEAWLFPFWITRLSVHLLATSPPSTSQSSFPREGTHGYIIVRYSGSEWLTQYIWWDWGCKFFESSLMSNKKQMLTGH